MAHHHQATFSVGLKCLIQLARNVRFIWPEMWNLQNRAVCRTFTFEILAWKRLSQNVLWRQTPQVKTFLIWVLIENWNKIKNDMPLTSLSVVLSEFRSNKSELRQDWGGACYRVWGPTLNALSDNWKKVCWPEVRRRARPILFLFFFVKPNNLSSVHFHDIKVHLHIVFPCCLDKQIHDCRPQSCIMLVNPT